MCMKKAPASPVSKADHKRAVQDRGGPPQVQSAKVPEQAKFISDNLIAAWNLCPLSILFSCLFSRHMECATYFFVAEACQLLVGDLFETFRISVSASATKPRSSSRLTVMLSPFPFIE